MTKQKKRHPDSFHSSFCPLLVLAQICGVLPVKGIFGGNLRFSWSNPFILYGLAISGVTFFFDGCYTVDNFNTGLAIDVFASTVFYTVCLLTTYFFFEIARSIFWIFQGFKDVEKNMMDYGYPKHLGLKIKLFFYPFLVISIIEHGTMALINLNGAWYHSAAHNVGFGYSFYILHFPAISRRLTYSGVGTIVLFWVNAMCTFNWNYLDFFLIAMSLEIYSRFSLINSRLKNSHLLEKDKGFWRKICVDYNRLSLLTKKIDKTLSKIILTSFFSNLYHLSLQLVRSLTVNGSLFQMTYFYFSMIYLITRLLLVLFFASKVHEESKKPAEALFSHRNPCHEQIRFLHQVITDEIALTGNKFFVITRKFVVSVIGTVVTYQVFLLQFNSLKYES